jgi:hypothetical protein
MQIVPSGQQKRSSALEQARSRGQHSPLPMQMVPSGQQNSRVSPVGVTTRHACSRGQHCPSMQTVPSGQQKSPFGPVHSCSLGQHLPLMQIDPSGQQTGPAATVPKHIRFSGQQTRKLSDGSGMHLVPGGQHVGPTPLPAGLVQHSVFVSQQTTTPLASTQQFVSRGQHLPVGLPLMS